MANNDRITIDELRKRMEQGEDFEILDVRNPQAWAESDVMIPQAVRVPLDSFEEHLYDIPKNKPIVAYCT
jgi:rhodanese-related sulfurtransferase